MSLVMFSGRDTDVTAASMARQGLRLTKAIGEPHEEQSTTGMVLETAILRLDISWESCCAAIWIGVSLE